MYVIFSPSALRRLALRRVPWVNLPPLRSSLFPSFARFLPLCTAYVPLASRPGFVPSSSTALASVYVVVLAFWAISTTGPGALVAIHGHSRNLLAAPLWPFGHARPFTESACSRMAALCPMHILLTLVPVVLGICSHMSLRMWAFCLPFCARRSGHSSAFVCVCPMSVGCKSAPRPAAKVSGGRLLLRRSLAAVCPPPPPSEARCHTSARALTVGAPRLARHTRTHTRTPTRL